MTPVQIGKHTVGPGHPAYIVAEIGINHNGDLKTAKRLIEMAAVAGCQAVKFQKRTIDVVYTPEELAKPRESPWGTTNGDQKRGLEFGVDQYALIDRWCKQAGIDWFASCWDEEAVDLIAGFDVVAFKIASASLTDHKLLQHTARKGKPLIVSTGGSTIEQVECALDAIPSECPVVLLHAVSTYPADEADLNLRMIETYRDGYNVPVGWSGHERGVVPSVAAVAMGACMVERHITLDRTMYGSDQSASLELKGLVQLVRDIRLIEKAMGDGIKRVTGGEVKVMEKLRRVG